MDDFDFTHLFQPLLFGHLVMTNSLQPHGQQHSRLLCLPLFLGVCSNSCPLSVMPSKHLILCCPLLLLPSIFPRAFSNESALPIRCPKYWCFNSCKLYKIDERFRACTLSQTEFKAQLSYLLAVTSSTYWLHNLTEP